MNKTAYTSYSDPHGIIYMDQYRRKRLMRTDELHKFSDGTLNDVRSALYDIAAGIRMKYLPMRKWSNLDKKRARVMVQDIDKQLYQRSQNQRDLPRDIPLDSVVVLRYEKMSKERLREKCRLRWSKYWNKPNKPHQGDQDVVAKGRLLVSRAKAEATTCKWYSSPVLSNEEGFDGYDNLVQ
uniref:Uncharacterized protein n=1 Tax=Tanacetum cinerariifolium TaxID=118510 RepID=A0A6L2LGM6_TANCI|nr:hypothetical protein [Tanacetum cinerariifolium]